MSHLTASRSRARCRGTVYLVALSTAMIVAVMGVSGLLAVRVQHRSAQLDTDLLAARMHARSAAELAMWHVANNADWAQLSESERSRDGFGTGGRGSFSFTYRAWDAEHAVGASGCAPVWVEATGYQGDARAVLEVLLEPVQQSGTSHRAALLDLVPLAYWPLDEASGDAIDRVAGRNGVYSEVTRQVHDATCCVTAAGYDGSNSTVQVAHDEALSPSSGSVVLFFRTEDINRDQGLFSKDARDFGTGGHFTLRLVNGSLVAQIGSTTQNYTATFGPLQEFQWYHVVVTFGEGGLVLYLDGQAVAFDGYTGGLKGNGEPIAIGADLGESNSNSFDGVRDPLRGQMFDVALFNYALTSQQVEQLASDGTIERAYRVAAMGWRDGTQ